MAKRKLTDEQEMEIIGLYTKSDKKSIASIAREYEIGTNTVKRILERNGINVEKVTNKISKEQEKEILDLYTSGKTESLTSIGKKYNVSRGTIKKVLKNNGINIEYDRNSRRNIEIDKYAEEIVDLFTNRQWNRNKIANRFNTSHIVIRRVLVQNGYIEDNYFKETKTYRIEAMVKNLRKEYQVDFAFFESLGDIDNLDIEKLIVLNDRSKRIIKRVGELLDYKSYIRKFYFDEQFNTIYDAWINSKKNKWLSPSIDHKIPLVKGGQNIDLNNLQFITWFENRTKCDMTEDEWNEFKIKTNTVSDCFIRI